MKARSILGVALAVLLLAGTGQAVAADGDSMVRTKSGLDGLPIVNTLCRLLGCQVLGVLDTTPGQTSGGSLFLVRGLVGTTVNLVLSLLGVVSIEPDLPVALKMDEDWGSQQASAAVLDQLWDQTPTTYYGASAWRSYLTQPANGIVRLSEAHCTQRTTGSGIVAVIDTGVDTQHPVLQPVLVPGWDFTANLPDAGEPWGSQQASAAVLDGSGVEWVNPSTAASVDQASAAVLDDGSHSAYGHGTMVAGVVHLAAPTAKIMPLKAFTSDGHGSTSDVVHAIYFATLKGAKVLNMSFSRTTPSGELKLALDFAKARGVIAVSSAGNQGTSALTYPAAYGSVIGVASTTNDDTRSTFSNYGTSTVWLAAPGEGIVTTYPGNHYAAAWGTSFSTPYVAGTAALLVTLSKNVTQDQAAWSVAHGRLLTSALNNGRLDVVKALAAARASLFPYGGASAVPASCDSDATDWSAP
jgi:hypothetical protein